MNPYLVLGVSSDATAAQLKAAFRAQAKVSHPDLFATQDAGVQAQAAASFRMVVEAFELLSDPVRRMATDARLVSEVPAGFVPSFPVGPKASKFTPWAPPSASRFDVRL